MMTPQTVCPGGKWGETFPCEPIANGLLDQRQEVPVWTAKNGWTSQFSVPGETYRAPDDGAQYPILLQGPPNAQTYEMTRENAGQMIPNRVAVNNGPGLSRRVLADIEEPIEVPEFVEESFVDMPAIYPLKRVSPHRMLVLFIVLYLFLTIAFRMRYPKDFAKLRIGIFSGFALLLAYYYGMTIWKMPMDFAGKMMWAILFILFFLLVSQQQ